jgi:cellobiose phosphorylase
MQYGYFDDQKKEYVITRPDTPQSWSNYLGSTEYGAIITNNAGGYGFYKSGAKGRFLRLRFNSIPMDQPGRYFYIRDQKNGDYWSASWQPVGKPLEQYTSTCRHGTAYTIIESKYSGIKSESTYFVPIGECFEYWRMKLTNESNTPRDLSVFSFCEFTNQWNTFQDTVNLQYSLFIIQGSLEGDNLLRIAIQDNLNKDSDDYLESDSAMNAWMGLIGTPLAGYDTSREAFLGTYRGYHNPIAVETGHCSNSNVFGDNGCGSMQSDLTLQPGESREMLILLGIGDARTVGKRTMTKFGSLKQADLELNKLIKHWHSKLGGMIVNTPDDEFNHTVNMWGQYNCLITFAWSRAASLVYNGERDGLGYRDSVQDVLGVLTAIPDEAKKRLELMLTGQVECGGAIPIIQPFDHKPGHEKTPEPEEFRSDDCLWFFNAVPAYVNETGDVDFYNKVLPYADHGETSVFGHMRRTLEFNLERTGKHGLPCGLLADWNDCLRLGYNGESLFVAFQVHLGLKILAEIAEQTGRKADQQWAIAQMEKLDRSIADIAWDGKWFIWAIAEDGTIYGTKDYSEGQVYLNTQVWSVISGAATPEQAKLSMQTVKDQLATPYGLMLSAPPFRKTSVEVMRAVVFNSGIKENAGIFNHTQGWGIMAECILGHGDQAWEYLRAAMPAAYNTKAEIRQSEPYVQGQATYSSFSPRAGNTRTSWLTGAAAWFYYSATQYILGIRPQAAGLEIDPCIPAKWDGFSVKRLFRGKEVDIVVHNPDHVCKGVHKLILNGKELQRNLVPADQLSNINQVEVWLGN